MNWQTLSTYGGAVLATATVTQFLKEFGVLKRVPTRLLSYGIALLLLLLSTQFTIGLTWANALTSVVNAAMVSLAGNGAYDAVVYTKTAAISLKDVASVPNATTQLTWVCRSICAAHSRRYSSN